MFDFGMRPGPSAWPPGTNPGRTYRFYTGTPVFPFGWGLSYSNITYVWNGPATQPLHLSAEPARQLIASDAKHKGVFVPRSTQLPALEIVNVTVTNNGPYDAQESVLCFLTPPDAGANGNPLEYLVGFTRVFLPVGQSQTVFFPLTARDITLINGDGERVATQGRFQVHVGVAHQRISRDIIVS